MSPQIGTLTYTPALVTRMVSDHYSKEWDATSTRQTDPAWIARDIRDAIEVADYDLADKFTARHKTLTSATKRTLENYRTALSAVDRDQLTSPEYVRNTYIVGNADTLTLSLSSDWEAPLEVYSETLADLPAYVFGYDAGEIREQIEEAIRAKRGEATRTLESLFGRELTYHERITLHELTDIGRPLYGSELRFLPGVLSALARAEAIDVPATVRNVRLAKLKADIRSRKRDQYVRPTHDSGPNLAAWLAKRSQTIDPTDWDAFTAVPLPADVDETGTASRHWGIEIEHPDAYYGLQPDGWDAKDDCSIESVNGGGNDECEYSRQCEDCEHDHEIYCGNEYTCDYCEYGSEAEGGVEFVSPVLDTLVDDDLIELLDTLDEREQNDSCGIHVHVDLPELGELSERDRHRALSRMVYAWSLIEPIMLPLYGRERDYYARPLTTDEIREAGRIAADRESVDSYYVRDRYRTINTQAYAAHGTVEFRAMGPVYKSDVIVRWVHLLRRFVSTVMADPTGFDMAPFRNARTLADVLAAIDWESN